jgi:molecular chaperone GrpE
VQKLLPTLDELEIALGHIHEGGKDSKEMHRGMELLYVNLLKTLKDEGVREIEALGQKLDPFLHEAIRYEEGEIEDGKISEVLKKGYVFRNHVIRHALVVVSSGKKKGENK